MGHLSQDVDHKNKGNLCTHKVRATYWKSTWACKNIQNILHWRNSLILFKPAFPPFILRIFFACDTFYLLVCWNAVFRAIQKDFWGFSARAYSLLFVLQKGKVAYCHLWGPWVLTLSACSSLSFLWPWPNPQPQAGKSVQGSHEQSIGHLPMESQMSSDPAELDSNHWATLRLTAFSRLQQKQGSPWQVVEVGKFCFQNFSSALPMSVYGCQRTFGLFVCFLDFMILTD